jgi:hypothetical protein
MNRLYSVIVDIEDDPAHFEGEALVMAPDNKTARKIGKEAVLETYHGHAGGWGTSDARATVHSVTLVKLPEIGPVLVSGDYHR